MRLYIGGNKIHSTMQPVDPSIEYFLTILVFGRITMLYISKTEMFKIVILCIFYFSKIVFFIKCQK